MQKNLHAALQRFHDQEMLDFKDDQPRADARLKLSELRLKAIHDEENVTRLLGKLQKAQHA